MEAEHVPAVINLTHLRERERKEFGKEVVEMIKELGAELSH